MISISMMNNRPLSHPQQTINITNFFRDALGSTKTEITPDQHNTIEIAHPSTYNIVLLFLILSQQGRQFIKTFA